MHERCEDPRHHAYARYGGRGISVCPRWDDPAAFIADMWPGFAEGLTLDRENNDLGYSPENCRWRTMKEQQNNRENTTMATLGTRTMGLGEWADEIGISYGVLTWRKKAGWSDERTLTTPTRKKRPSGS
jgi:hypothetical protein